MKTWLGNFSQIFLDSVRDLFWRQWSSLGVPGAIGEMGDWIVDPEALLVVTIQFGRYDPRLFDAVLDWCLGHGKWISTTRLRYLRPNLTSDEARILTAIASVLARQDPSAKWKALRKVGLDMDASPPETPIPLFLTPDDRPHPGGTATDQTFLQYGVTRPPWERGRVAHKPDLRKPAALRLRMRALFGIGSRAEIILFLLTHRGGHPRGVARQINHAQPPVARAMAEMAQAGVLTEHRTAREVEYSLDKAAWRRLLGVPDGLRWTQWGLVFRALRSIWSCLQEMHGRPLTSAVLGSQLRTCAGQVNPLLHESELGAVFEAMALGRPEDYTAVFEGGARELFRRLETTAATAAPSR